MFSHLHKNNKQNLNFINSLELLKNHIFIFFKFFMLVFALFTFSIAQAETVARQHDFKKDIQELLTETPAKQTEYESQNDFKKDVVEEFEMVQGFKNKFFPEVTALKTKKEDPKIPEGNVRFRGKDTSSLSILFCALFS